MTSTKINIKIFSAIVLLTSLLTWFFYEHEKLPKPLRAFTALLETPVAIASGISYYLKLGIPVYESFCAVLITNFIFSALIVVLVSKFFHRRK
jgi:hypothetical protein